MASHGRVSLQADSADCRRNSAVVSAVEAVSAVLCGFFSVLCRAEAVSPSVFALVPTTKPSVAVEADDRGGVSDSLLCHRRRRRSFRMQFLADIGNRQIGFVDRLQWRGDQRMGRRNDGRDCAHHRRIADSGRSVE